MVEPDRPQVTTWRMRIACWIPKATSTHSEYVTLIAFSLQQWLHERASIMPNTYIARLFEDIILFLCLMNIITIYFLAFIFIWVSSTIHNSC
jgi:hypothetical protein